MRFDFCASISISVHADNKQQAMKLAWTLLQRRIDGQQFGFKKDGNEGAEVIDWLLREELIGTTEIEEDRLRSGRERIVIDDRSTHRQRKETSRLHASHPPGGDEVTQNVRGPGHRKMREGDDSNFGLEDTRITSSPVLNKKSNLSPKEPQLVTKIALKRL